MRSLTYADFDEVINDNELVFVDMWAEWCPPCRAVAPILEELEEEYPNVLFTKLDVDSYPDIAKAYDVRTIPSFFLFNSGVVEKSGSGARGKDDLIQEFFSDK